MIAKKTFLILALLVALIVLASSASATSVRYYTDEDVKYFSCSPGNINEGEGGNPLRSGIPGNFQDPGPYFNGRGIPNTENDPCGLYGQVTVHSSTTWVCIKPGTCCENNVKPGIYTPFDTSNLNRYDAGGLCSPVPGAFLSPIGLPVTCATSCPQVTGFDAVTLGISTANPNNIGAIPLKQLVNKYNMDLFGIDPTLVDAGVSFPLLRVQENHKVEFTVNIANLGTAANQINPILGVAYYGFCNDPTNPLGPFIPVIANDFIEYSQASFDPPIIEPFAVARATFTLDATEEKRNEAISYVEEQLNIWVNPNDVVLPICVMPNYSINLGGTLAPVAKDINPSNNPFQFYAKIVESFEPACTSGDIRTCGRNEGICTPGIETCVNNIWSPCRGTILPMPVEICDNRLDDDCDGQTDEDPCSDFCIDCIGPGPTDPEAEILGNCFPSGAGISCDFWMSPDSPPLPLHHLDENPSDTIGVMKAIPDPVLGTNFDMPPVTIGDSFTQLPMVQTTFEFYLNGKLERRFTNNPRGVATFVPLSLGEDYVVVAYRPDEGSRRIGYFVPQAGVFDPLCQLLGICVICILDPDECYTPPPECDGPECTVTCLDDPTGINCSDGCDPNDPACPDCYGSGCDGIETCIGPDCEFPNPGPYDCYGNNCPDCETQDCTNVCVNCQDTTCFGDDCPLECGGEDCRIITVYCNAVVNSEGRQVTENTYPGDITRVCQVFCEGDDCPEVPKIPIIVRAYVDDKGIHIVVTWKNGEPVSGVGVTPGLQGNYYTEGSTDPLGEYTLLPPLSGVWQFILTGDEFTETIEVPWSNDLASIMNALSGPLGAIFGTSALKNPELLILMLILSLAAAYLAYSRSKLLFNKGAVK